MQKIKVLSTIEEIKAYNDPYRIEILINISKLNRPATCKEIADIMHEIPSKVHYHIKKMEKAGILEIVDTKEINGIIAKYYQPTAKEFNVDNKYLDEASKNIMGNETCKLINGIFDTAKKDYLNIIEKSKTQKDNENKGKKTGHLHYSEIYITDEQANKLDEYVLEFIKQNESKNKERKNYKVFFGIIDSSDDENE